MMLPGGVGVAYNFRYAMKRIECLPWLCGVAGDSTKILQANCGWCGCLGANRFAVIKREIRGDINYLICTPLTPSARTARATRRC
jgi:hypothetical protein